MSRWNYETNRNRPLIEPRVVDTYKLTPDIKKKLYARVAKFNSWEKAFYINLKKNNYQIISEKQWNVIQKLILL